jgi:hypothetical protein
MSGILQIWLHRAYQNGGLTAGRWACDYRQLPFRKFDVNIFQLEAMIGFVRL